jgi:putative ABC transport system substrate-binding protein
VTRVAHLGTAEDWKGADGAAVRAASEALRVTLIQAEHTPVDYHEAFATIKRERPDGLFVAANPANFGHRALIIKFAAEHRLPAIYANREITELGGLMSYGIDNRDMYRRAAEYVHGILNGETPGALPIEQPTRFPLIINLKTASTLGVTISPALLARADEVIE